MIRPLIHLMIASSLLAAAMLLLASCSETSTVPDDDDHEIISYVIIQAVAEGSTDTLRFGWRDLDGPGGTVPLIDTVRLQAQTVYNMEARILVGSEEITSSIDAEKENHQFLWDVDGIGFDFSTTDWDATPKLYSRRVSVTLQAAGTGTFDLELYHYDDPADKVNGQPGDETDVAVTFPLIVR